MFITFNYMFLSTKDKIEHNPELDEIYGTEVMYEYEVSKQDVIDYLVDMLDTNVIACEACRKQFAKFIYEEIKHFGSDLDSNNDAVCVAFLNLDKLKDFCESRAEQMFRENE